MIIKQVKGVVILHVIIFAVLYIVAPPMPNTYFSIASFFFYCFQILSLHKYVKKVDKRNYFEFNMMFFIMLTLCTYIIPIFYILGLDQQFYTTVLYNEKYMNTALLINSVAVEAYLLGFIKGQVVSSNKNGKDEYIFRNYLVPINKVSRFLSIIGTLFVAVTLNKISEGSSDVRGPIVTLMVIIIILPLLIAGYSNKYYGDKTIAFILRNKLILICSLLVCFRMIMLGDRLTPLTIIFTIAFIYSRFVYPINRKMLLIGIIGGSILMFLISFTRHSFMDSKSASSMFSSFQSGSQEILSSEDRTVLFQDVIPINLDLLLGVEYVDKNGFFKPMRFIVEALAPIPFIPSQLKEFFFGGYTSSAVELTRKNKQVSLLAGDSGIGNHIVSDIYMSWGVIGVLIVFFIWGKVIGYSYMRVDISFISCIIYASMMSYAIYFPRATIDTNFRDIAYIILMFYFMKSFIIKK